MFSHNRQDLTCHLFHADRISNTLQFSIFIRTRELKRITQTTSELKVEVTLKFLGSNRHLIPLSIQFKHRTFPFHFLVKKIHFTSTGEPPFDHPVENMFTYIIITGLNHKTNF